MYISLRSRNASRDQAPGSKGKTDPAIAYLRTYKRQRQAIAAFAQAHGYRIVGEFYDASVSGADPIVTRPGFTALLTYSGRTSQHAKPGGARSEVATCAAQRHARPGATCLTKS